MSKLIHVIYTLDSIPLAMGSMAQTHPELLSYNDDKQPVGWNSFHHAGIRFPGSNMYYAILPLSKYLEVLYKPPVAFSILVAGYPQDKIETMLSDRELNFYSISYDDNGDQIKAIVDLTLKDSDENLLDRRIAPTDEMFDLYEANYPSMVTIKDEDGNDQVVERGNFVRLG